MKKLLLGSLLTVTYVFADVATVLPYSGIIEYGNDTTKSAKDRAELWGIYTSVGNLGYLFEVNYSHIHTRYNNTDIEALSQDDITIAYGKYFSNFMFKLGIHYINTNDKQLDNGFIVISQIGGYRYIDKNKFNYGLEVYYSHYNDGHNESYEQTGVNIYQITPYFSYHKFIHSELSNTVTLKANLQIANDYLDDTYSSFELSDTVTYKNFFTTFKGYTGEMRTGIKDGGMTVYNTLDLMKHGFDIKLGYYINRQTTIAVNYGQNTYREFDETFSTIIRDNTNWVAVATLSYTF